MKVYILHETHSDPSLNDHEAFASEGEALKFFEATKQSIDSRHTIEQTYCEAVDEYFVEVDDYQTIRLYITEHQLWITLKSNNQFFPDEK